MNQIHPTAYIGENVKLGNNNIIHQNVFLDGNIKLGDNNIIGANSVLVNNVIIGSGNHFVGSISIGSLGEMGTKGDVFIEDGVVQIGDKNIFREFITINSPVRLKKTEIGNSGYFMARTHIPHDAIVRNHVTMATNSIIGGGCVVNDHAYIGLGSITHQWLEIGKFAMVGMQAVNNKDIPPYMTVVGVPSKINGINKIGLTRKGIDLNLIEEAENILKDIWHPNFISKNYIVNDIIEFYKNKPNCLKTFLK
jgi:UDP-N-acetylglucosamine acyltransferase